MPHLDDVGRGKTLSSWKEIAARLGVTVRTVQRWEKMAGLPIHRRGAGNIGRIFAHSVELDRWLADGGAERAHRHDESHPENGLHAIERKPDSRAGGRWWIGGTAGLLVGLCAAGFWAMQVLARTPSSWAFEGSKLVVKDARGRVCWEKQFPAFNAHFGAEVTDKVLIADIDGDGRLEVLFNFFPEDMSSLASSLMCFDAKGKLRWEYRYGREMTFGGRYFEATYKGALIRPVTVGGKPQLLAVANHYIWYPAQVSLLDAKTGRLLEEYWHPGSIYHCALTDIDADGDREAVFGAIDNPGAGVGHAAVGILKLPFSKAPKRAVGPNELLPPVTGGGEFGYALFPNPDVDEVLSTLPIMMSLRVDRDRIFVELPAAEHGARVYYLDFGLKVLDFRVADNFAAVHQRLFVEGLLDHKLTAAEISALGRVALFRWAPDGNSGELRRFWGE